jgi:hypothetical protein
MLLLLVVSVEIGILLLCLRGFLREHPLSHPSARGRVRRTELDSGRTGSRQTIRHSRIQPQSRKVLAAAAQSRSRSL